MIVVALLAMVHLIAPVDRITAPSDSAAGDFSGVRLRAAVTPLARSVDVYEGHGAWVDVYDFVPALQQPGVEPAVSPADVEDMARHGVQTLYLQAAHVRLGGPGELATPDLLGQFLERAHAAGIRVVGWFLPYFGDVELDLAYLTAMADFESAGHRFDGLAVDIEWTRTTPDPAARSARLVELSRRLRAAVGDDALGAIVLPPVQMEDVNPALWPAFPWRELAPFYDAWVPMGYWTVRSPESGLRDGYVYTAENVRRLRLNVGDDRAVVHAVGGIGDAATPAELEGFADALSDTGAAGGSIYDWSTLGDAARAQLADVLDH